jgi:HSP20 family protein
MTRRPKNGPEGREALDRIEAQLGGLLGPLSETLGRVIDAARNVQETGGAGPIRSEMCVRVGGVEIGGGAPAETTAPRAAPPPREPAFDVWNEGGRWSLTAELPGVAQSDLRLSLDGAVLLVETVGARRYRFATEAPCTRLDAISRRLVNGILELSTEAPS